LLATSGLGACKSPYLPLAAMTVIEESDTQSDVVWIQDNKGRIYRCSHDEGGPYCERVKKRDSSGPIR
ncbi:MAG: hypothetical protein AAFP04_01070, partial [Myxococcota bacterium]